MTKTAKIAAALGVVAALGLSAAPLAGYAAPGEIPVNVSVPEVIEIVDPTDPTTTAEISPNALNYTFDGTTLGSTLTQNLQVTGNTTAANGFTVSMSTIGAQNALVNTVDGTQLINPTVGGSATLEANAWGWRSGATNYAPVPSSAAPVTVFNTGTAGSATRNLTFGVNVDSTLLAGMYTNTIVFTIAHNL
jgi:hypothetical protein